jgi:sugar lactone lactonase YvrE
VAMWGGGQVLHISPHGEVQASLPMPVRQPSSCVFGGERLDVLYVTSATDGLGLPPGSEGDDGSVFAIRGTGAQGRPATRFGPAQKAAGIGGDTR